MKTHSCKFPAAVFAQNGRAPSNRPICTRIEHHNEQKDPQPTLWGSGRSRNQSESVVCKSADGQSLTKLIKTDQTLFNFFGGDAAAAAVF